MPVYSDVVANFKEVQYLYCFNRKTQMVCLLKITIFYIK